MTLTSEPINIMRATAEHVEQLAPLFDAYRQFYRQPTNLEGAREFLMERLKNDESIVFLALMDGIAVGFTQLYPSFSSVSIKRLWVLNDLYVMPAARKQGVATALLERAKQLAVETQAKGMVLSTATDNDRAQRLYEQLGWKRDEAFYHYYLNV